MFVNREKTQAQLTLVTNRSAINQKLIARLRGLDPNKMYRCEENDTVYSGALLMNGGFNMTLCNQSDGTSHVVNFYAQN